MIAVAGGILIVLIILAAIWFGWAMIEEGSTGCGCLILIAVAIAVAYIIF